MAPHFHRRDAMLLGSAAALFGLSARAAPPATATGHCNAAMIAATETVDPHFSRSQVARNVLMHVCETLLTVDERAAPQLQLAEKLEVSPDFRTFTFTLRKGVPFHNGKEMTATDVQRSLERFAKVSPEKGRLAPIDRMRVADPHVLVVELKTATPAWVEILKSPASPMTIIPAEECDKDVNKAQPVSTGPFRFVDWDGATQLNLRRFAEYQPNTAYPGRDGYGGRRTVHLETATFRVITEASARVAGLQTGQFQLVDQVPIPAAKRLAEDAQLRVYDRLPTQMEVAQVNFARAPTDRLAVRQAIQAAIDVDEIMGVATNGVYRANPSMLYPDNVFYPKQAKQLVYNAGDAARARALLAQAGYRGEEVLILTSEIPTYKDASVVLAEQLKAVGMNTRLEVLDWPAATAKRNDPKSHNLFVSGFAIQPMLGPYEYPRFFTGADNWSFAPEDAAMAAAWARLSAATTDAERTEAWWQIEQRINAQVYALKLGDVGLKQASSAKLQNFKPYDGMRLWDIWLS